MQKLLKFLALLVAVAGSEGRASVLFEDGFESGTLGPAWTVTTTNDGRAVVGGDFQPATGAKHLVMDDAKTDATFSAVGATVSLDLRNKKNVVLTFKAKSLGNEPHDPYAYFYPTGNADDVSITVDGGVNWYTMESLAYLGADWQSFSIDLDYMRLMTGVAELGADVRIRFSEYDNAAAPIDGIAIDDVVVTGDEDRRVVVELPGTLVEGSGPHTGYVVLDEAPVEPLTVFLVQTLPAGLQLPVSVVVPAGESVVSFSFSVINDDLVNVTRVAEVNAIGEGLSSYGANGLGSGTGVVTILDDEVPPVATMVLPEELPEGSNGYSPGSVRISKPAAVDLTFHLTVDPYNRLYFDASVTIPAGQTQASFQFYPYSNGVVEGDVSVAITAFTGGIAPATGRVLIKDIDVPHLILTFPQAIGEGSSAAATLSLSNPLPGPLEVILESTGLLNLPATLTIPAGQTSVAFTIAAADDSLVNLSREMVVYASGNGVNQASGTLTVVDDEPRPLFTLTVPAEYLEGVGEDRRSKISISSPVAVPLTFNLSKSPDQEMIISSTVTIPAGSTEASFVLGAINDDRIDGNLPVTVTAKLGSEIVATARTTTIDDETRSLGIYVNSSITEGQAATGSVYLSGSLSTVQVVHLTSSDPAVVVPSAVAVPAGAGYVSFPISAPENSAPRKTAVVTISASASGFSANSAAVTLLDNDPASYQLSTQTDIVNVSEPLTVNFTATDSDGNSMTYFDRPVDLALLLPDGSTRALMPVADSLVSSYNGWTQKVILPAGVPSSLRLRASDAHGTSADSNVFDPMQTLALTGGDLVWDAGRALFYATIPATAAERANSVVAVDPATLQITASVDLPGSPGRVVLTDGGEYLYVALQETGRIAKIDAATLSVISTFAVGNSASYGTLFAEDLCPVAGQPELLIVSQSQKTSAPYHDGVAVYDHGVARAVEIEARVGSNQLQPSADPTVFFGYSTEANDGLLRRLKLTADGITQIEAKSGVLPANAQSIRSDGNQVFSFNGGAADGGLMTPTGTYPITGMVRPDLASGRVVFMEYSGAYGNLTSWEPTTRSLVRRLTMPSLNGRGSLLRWGGDGLAFRSDGLIHLINSRRLVPEGSSADLAVSVQAGPDSPVTSDNVTYTVTASNATPQTAVGATLTVTLSDGQAIQSASASSGVPVTSGSTVTLITGEIPATAPVKLTIVTRASSAGPVTGSALLISDSIDPDFTNNRASQSVSVRFPAAMDLVNSVRLPANNLIADPTRNLLWATSPASAAAPFAKSLVSIDPLTGALSTPFPLDATPLEGAIALSDNGRYLYVGLADVAEISRIDLSATPPSAVRIPLPNLSSLTTARDIEVLPGDGTSILVVANGANCALVIDGLVARKTRTASYPVHWIEKTVTPGLYIAGATSTYLSKLTVVSGGVTQATTQLYGGSNTKYTASGNRLMSNSGQIIDPTDVSVKWNLGSLGYSGTPCLDTPNQKAYLIYGSYLYGFTMATGSMTSAVTLPSSISSYSFSQGLVRWGPDGLAIRSGDGNVYVLRSSVTIPETADQNADGISDRWAAIHFNRIDIDPGADPDGDGLANAFEYAFGKSPVAASNSDLQITAASGDGLPVLRVQFPRRSTVARPDYSYEVSSDLTHWTAPAAVTENVHSPAVIEGISMNTVEALITPPPGGAAFVRLRWSK